MAHFAILDSTNTVVDVIKIGNDDVNNLDYPESEPVGIEFLNSIMPESYLTERYSDFTGPFYFKQTSYNNNFRRTYCGQGYTYRADLDRFVPPKPFPSWIYDSTNNKWDPPIANPFESEETCPESIRTRLERYRRERDPLFPFMSASNWDEENQKWVATCPVLNGTVWDEENQTWISDPDE